MPPAITARDPTSRPWLRRSLLALLGLAVAACASAGGRAPVPDTEAAACRPTGEAAARPATLSVAAAGEVDPLHAPLPTSEAERVLFRHLYATLVEVDCGGNIRPGLAEAWSSDRDGARWTFRLDPDARFADGSRVTAGAVVTAWHENDLAAGVGRRSPLADASVSAPSERTVVVTLEDPVTDPAAFAEPRFAVAGSGGLAGWPAPSGTHRPAAVDGPTLPGRTVGLAPREGASAGSRLRLVAFGTSGARDLLDAGSDLLLTRDPGAARYAGTLSEYRVHALPWDRAWLLAIPGRPDPGPGGDADAWGAVREGLAGEAIPAEARPADGATPRSACPAASPGEPAPSADPSGPAGRPARAGSGSIVHPSHEPSGRALAARLAALAGGAGPEGDVVSRALAGGGSALRTEGLGPAAYARSLRRGTATAYLLALPRRPLAPCLQWRELLRRAPWLPDEGRLVALVDTRPFLVLDREVAGLRLDWDGTPRLDGAGRR